MRTRSQGPPEVLLDPEIESSQRRKGREKRRAAMAANPQNGGIPPEQAARMLADFAEMQRQMANMGIIVPAPEERPLNHMYRPPTEQFQGGGWART